MIGIIPATSNNKTDIAITGDVLLGINIVITSEHVFN
jgi:hypothetical protein